MNRKTILLISVVISLIIIYFTFYSRVQSVEHKLGNTLQNHNVGMAGENSLKKDSRITNSADLPDVQADNNFRSSVNTGKGVESKSYKPNQLDEISSKNKKVLELINYSRSGNFKDTRSRLKNAFEEKILNSKEYYGELAHMLSVPVNEPLSIMQEIVASGDEYGYEVMIANIAGNEYLVKNMRLDERDYVVDVLIKNKPQMNGDIHEIGMSNIYRYDNWLKSLRSFSRDESMFLKILEDILINKMTDPREVFAIKYSLSNDVIFEKIDVAAYKKYQSFLDGYMNSYPDNSTAKYIYSSN